MAVYLIHFTQPYHHARHYIGFTADLPRRIAEHQRDYLHLMGAVNAAKIPWVVAKVWPDGDRELERRLKRWKGAGQFCPICQAEAGQYSTAILPAGWGASLSPEGVTPAINQAVPQAGDRLEAFEPVA